MTQPSEHIPAAVLGSWGQAEARLYQVVLTRPDAYQRGVVLVGRVSAVLVAESSDVEGLLARAAAEETAGWPIVGDQAGLADVALEGLDLPMVAGAAFAMAGRRLAGAAVQARRRALLAAASRDGVRWVVLEERGDPEGTPWSPYHRLEVRADTGDGVLVSTEPAVDLTGVVHRVRRVSVDAAGAVAEVEPAPVTGAPPDGAEDAGEEPDVIAREEAACRLRALIDEHP